MYKNPNYPKKYRLTHKRKIKKYKQKWYLKNKKRLQKTRKSYYERNKVKIKERIKIYVQNNKEIISMKKREHYMKHKKKILAKGKIYRDNNKDKIKERRKYFLETPKWIYYRLKGNAKRKSRFFNLKIDDFVDWYDKNEKICHYCNRTLEELVYDKTEPKNMKMRLTIDRKDNDRGYTIDNIVLSCNRCNMIKGNFFNEQDMLKIGKIVRRKSSERNLH